MDALIISNALDTNGQNRRYVDAAKKHGANRKIIKALAIGEYDPGGVLGRFHVAAEKHGVLRIRSVHRSEAYFEFPTDIRWTRHNDRDIKALILEADIVHLNNSWRPIQRFGSVRKPMLLHHHGSMFRSNPKLMLAHARQARMTQAVSTIDLMQSAPDVLHWLPTAYDIGELQTFGKAHRRKPDKRVLLVHAPTNRLLKNTDLFISVVSELQAEGLPLDLELVENKTNAECLAAKARADIVFDQLMFGYGCNAVEAWGMGVPVIAGGEDWTLAEMRRQWVGLPFYEATEGTLKERIRDMVLSADLRAEWSAKGLAHVKKYHDELPALERLSELYVMTIKGYQSGRSIPGKEPVLATFKSRTKRPISLDGQRVEFPDGVARVTDPFMVSRLRYFAKHRPSMGIKEEVA